MRNLTTNNERKQNGSSSKKIGLQPEDANHMKLRGKSNGPYRETRFDDKDEDVKLMSGRGEGSSSKRLEAELAATTILHFVNTRDLSRGKVQINNEALRVKIIIHRELSLALQFNLYLLILMSIDNRSGKRAQILIFHLL